MNQGSLSAVVQPTPEPRKSFVLQHLPLVRAPAAYLSSAWSGKQKQWPAGAQSGPPASDGVSVGSRTFVRAEEDLSQDLVRAPGSGLCRAEPMHSDTHVKILSGRDTDQSLEGCVMSEKLGQSGRMVSWVVSPSSLAVGPDGAKEILPRFRLNHSPVLSPPSTAPTRIARR